MSGFAISAWPGGPGTFTINTGPGAPETIHRAGPYDHQRRWLVRLLTQFRPDPEMQGKVKAPLGASTVLEGVFWTLLTTTLENAVGQQLDVIGARWRFGRDGLDDDEYRRLIPIWAAACRSSGTMPEVVALLDRLDPDNEFEVDPLALDPKSFRVNVTFPVLDDATAELYQRFVRRARPSATRVWLYSYPQPDSETFTLADYGSALDSTDGATLGLGDFDDTEGAGGGLAREVIA